MQAPQGVDGHERPVDQNLLGGRGNEVGGKFAVEGFADVFLAVETDENVGGFVFARGVYDAGHGIYRTPAVGLHAHPHGGGHLGGVVQAALRLVSPFGIVIEHHTHRGELRRRAVAAQHQGHVGERNEHVRVAQRHNERILVGRCVFLRRFARENELARGAFGEG